MEGMYPKAAANNVKIVLKQGVSLEKEVVNHKGHRKNPITDEELEQKFHDLSKNYLSENKRKKLLKNLWKLRFNYNILRKI